ncbi:precorrin-2 dehydrogenase [Geothermobacter ehrlichii]|uniref:precorrin-2 dehydrogenase n=1 Tax=Geothermobacter ehrlichii TaxID=213224 RepID=A0A5D3WM90_9BACT|nr:bifunctional precorrin-2 dehydrogenase/sirohydrochlorin ferrochelatase [Geothermobacter ehrlichii]TYO99313.1 precorrin-2 dehydrogenase [Geothermobacter ehrlichii]
MSLYPVMLDLRDRLCLVVGGGRVGCRKIRGLLAAGARVRLVSPACSERLTHPAFEWRQRPYRRGDLAGARLVFAATDDPAVNRAVADEARKMGVPVNVATGGHDGDLLLPAVRRRGAIVLAVSTGGGSPALSAVVADRLFQQLGPEWERVLEIASRLRRRSLTSPKSAEYNQSILRQLLDDGLAGLLRSGRREAVDELLRRHCGVDGLAELGIDSLEPLP